MSAIEIKNLCFRYSEYEVLKNIHLKIDSGEFIGILGPNGCGKSTLIKQILGIFKPFSGSIEIFGKSISNYNEKTLASIIGFVPQKSLLAMSLSVEDMLYMGRYSRLESPLKGYSLTDKDKIQKIMQKLKITHLKNRDIQSLSGGEFQRVLLGRALVCCPKILLLDEPTSMLDINYAIEMMKICEELCIEEKLTIVAVFHDINLASLFCSKIFFLKEGKILYTGKPKELFQPEILEEIYGFSPDVITHQGKTFIILKKE